MLTSIKVFTGNTITAGQPIGITLNKVQGVLEKGVKYSLQFKVINYSSINTLNYIYVGTQKISDIDISQGTVIDTVDGKDVRLCSVEFTASSKVTNPVIKIGRNMESSDTSNTLMYELTDFQLERGYKTDYSPNSNDLQIVKTDLESKINQLADSLQFYVAKNDFDNLGNTVSSALGQIEVSTGEISLKVEQTDIDNAKNELEGSIDKKISNAKAEIKMTTDSISQRVSSTESTTSTLSNKVTVVEGTANTAKSTADNANTLATTANNTANTNKNNIATLQSTVTTTNNKVAELTTSLDSITQRVQSTESSIQNTNNMLSEVSTGVNKVLFEIYGKTGQDGTEIVTIDDYLDATLLHTLLLDDFQMFGGSDEYLGKMTTHLYFNQNVTHTVQAFADDGSSIYLNGTLVVSMPTCTETPVTLNFKQGWNKIVWVYNEGNGGDGCRFTPSIKTLPGLVYMNAYPVSGDIEGLQAINSTVKTTKNKVAEIVTNLDSITQRVSSNESTIQTTNNKIDNLQVGGRNLIIGISEDAVAYGANQTEGLYYDIWNWSLTGLDGSEYVISFDARADDELEILCYFYEPSNTTRAESSDGIVTNHGDGQIPVHLTTEWKRYWIKWTHPAGYTGLKHILLGRTFTLGITAYIKNVKFEKGNIATAWTPAPEDVQGQINETNSRVENTSNKVAEIITNLDGITQRVSSNESTTSTLTSQMNAVDGKINSAKNDAIYESSGIKDTRNDNQPPSWYMTNYGNRTVDEFKFSDVLGIQGDSVYGTLTTKVPWADASGGYPTQTFVSSFTQTFERKGVSLDTWGEWVQVENIHGSQAKANQALNDAKAFTTTEVTKTNNKVAEIVTNLDSITSRVSATESTVVNTQTQLDNLKIGGRNLIKNGSFKGSAPGKDVSTFDYWRVWGTPLICYHNQNVEPYNETGFIYILNSNFSNYSPTGIHSNRIPVNQLKKGGEYTVSYYYLRESNVIPGNARLEFLNENCDTIVHNIVLSTQNLAPSMKPSDEYKTKVTFQMPSIDFAYLQIVFDHAGVVEGHNGGSILSIIGQVQLEEGNTCTEWKPAFEETEDSINNVNNNLTTNYSTTSQMNSAIEQKANEIRNTVSESYSTKEEIKTLTDTTKGMSKWLFERYTCSNASMYPTLEHLANETLIHSELRDVLNGYISDEGSNYIGVFTTHLYYENDETVNTYVITDDNGAVYLNGELICQPPSCQQTPITFNFRKGLNKLVIMYAEGGGGDGATVGSFGNFKFYGAYATNVLAQATGEVLNNLQNNYATKSEVTQTATDLTVKFTESGGANLLHNGHAYRDPQGNIPYWVNNGGSVFDIYGNAGGGVRGNYFSLSMPNGMQYNDWIELKGNTHYVYQAQVWTGNSFTGNNNVPLHYWFSSNKSDIDRNGSVEFLDYNTTVSHAQTWTQVYIHFRTTEDVYMKPFVYGIDSSISPFYITEIMLSESRVVQRYSPHPSEVYDGITKIDKNGITVTQSNAKTKTTMSADGFAITRTDKNADIFRVGSNGLLTLNGVFKCYKDNANMSGARLESSGAIMFGYNSSTSTKPVFASGLWTDENMGYFSVGYTRADVTDENGCLWMSPQQGNNGCRLTYSKLVGGNMVSTNLYFQKDGALLFSSNINGLNGTDDRYTYQFDSGVSTRSLRCDNLRTYHIYPRNTGSSNIGSPSMRYRDIFVDSLSTTNNQLRLGTVKSDGSWQTYGALDINSSTGYIFPHKGNGQLSLGTSGNRFHGIYLVNSPNVSSDERLKTDIHYLDEPMPEEPTILDGRVERNMKITTKDMYDFVKDDLKLASYRYNLNLERGNTSTDYGFIAQDILYTKVGSELIQLEDKEDLNSTLSYNQGNYISTIVGALQEAINKIEVLEKKVQELESKLV